MRIRIAFWALIVSLAVWACESEMVEKENNKDIGDIENPDNEIKIDTFYVVIDTVFNALPCMPTEENFGELKAHIFDKEGLEIDDYSVYNFQWYNGPDLLNPIAQEDSSRAINLPEGNYTLLVTDTIGRTVQLSAGIDKNPVRYFPNFQIIKLSDQTEVDPPNGSLMVVVEGGNDRYTFQWEDSSAPLEGKTSYTVTGLNAGTYTIAVTAPNGCKGFADAVIADLTGE